VLTSFLALALAFAFGYAYDGIEGAIATSGVTAAALVLGGLLAVRARRQNQAENSTE